MESDTLTMSVDSEGRVTWSSPRSPKPFTIQLFGVTQEQLFRNDDPEGQDCEVARCSSWEGMVVEVKPGNYSIVGGDFTNTSYLNLIEVSSDGQVGESKMIVDQVYPSFNPSLN